MDIELQFGASLPKTLLDKRLKAMLVGCQQPSTLGEREFVAAHAVPETTSCTLEKGAHHVRLGGSGSELRPVDGRRLVYLEKPRGGARRGLRAGFVSVRGRRIRRGLR